MDTKTNIKAGQNKERKHGRNWKESYVVFIVLPILLTMLVPLGGLPYLCGRLNFHMGLVACMIYPVIGVFIVICFVGGIERFFRDWRKRNRKGKRLIIAQIGIPIVFVAFFIIPFFIPIESDLWPPGKAFTYGFRNRMKSKADIEAIRDWLGTLDKEDYDVHGDRLHPDKWPKSLKALKPVAVLLLADKNGNPQVRMMWGAAIFHWGFVVGMGDMEIPPSYFNQRDEYWLLVEPGVYVWESG